MKKNVAVTALATALLIGGCTPAPQVKVTPAPLNSKPAQCQLSMQQMELALVNATHQSQWQLTKQGKGSFTALRRDGSRDAKIAISHTARRYHVTYLDSHGLGYDGNQIDASYRRWLNELDRAVTNDIAVLCAQAETSKPLPQSLLTPEPKIPDGEELETPVMVESVPSEMLEVR